MNLRLITSLCRCIGSTFGGEEEIKRSKEKGNNRGLDSEKREGESHSLFSHPGGGGGTISNYRRNTGTILQESNSKLAILGYKRKKSEYRIVIEMTNKYVAEVNFY